jgi:RimJ/RimL family protein N-acetyltransferase
MCLRWIAWPANDDKAERLCVNTPVLETSRLILRAHTLADFDTYAAIWADADVTRWTGVGKPVERDEAWLRFLRFAGHWELMGYGFWALEEKSTGAMIGEAGFTECLRKDFHGRTAMFLDQVL